MAQFTKVVNGDSVRYKDGGRFVKAEDVPENVRKSLDEQPQGTILDELGDVVDPTTDSDEGSEDEQLNPQTPPAAEDDSTVDDEGAGDDGEEDEADDEEETPEETPEAPAKKTAARRSRAKTEVGGMGFPAKDGKTLSIFSDVPHETVKNVGGIMVPLTNEELVGDASKGIAPKNDAEIIERLKELGKVPA